MALKSANHPIRWRERIGRVAGGHTFKKLEEILLDFMLYPAVIAWLGVVKGGAIMMVFSALMCYFYLRLYDWSGKDWFGFELLKEVRDGEEKQGRFASFVQKITRKGDWVAFLLLSCYMDPFMTTVYMRRSAEAYNGFSTRDWKIFWASVIVANLWWTVLMTLAVTGGRYILNWLGFN